MNVSVEQFETLEAVVLTNGDIRATVLPRLGAKIISVVDLGSARELVWRDPNRSVGELDADALYGDGDASGIDDCFPTVDACEVDGISLQDHGCVWSRSWSWRQREDVVDFDIEGTFGRGGSEFMLRRTMSMHGHRLRLDYRLTNTGDACIEYQWTGHPLFRADPDMRILLPVDSQMRTAFATGGRIDLDPAWWRWPKLPARGGEKIDAREVTSWTVGANEKYWAVNGADFCRLRYPESNEELVIAYDRRVLPSIAVCVNYGGWPPKNPGYWIAVEPSTSPHDSLATTIACSRERRLQSGKSHSWWWSLGLEKSRGGTGDMTWS